MFSPSSYSWNEWNVRHFSSSQSKQLNRTSGLSFGPLSWIRHCYCYSERETSILVLLHAFMKKGIMIRLTNLETWPNRDVFIFWIHASAFAIRRAIDVLQSMNQKRRWRILQITSLRHFIYSTNAQAYSDLNFWDIVGGGGGSIWRIVRTSWRILATPLV